MIVATDAQSAITQLRHMSFDLIILDINLPDQTGWDVLRTAQREARLSAITIEDGTSRLPVVVLSAVRVSQRRLTEFHPLAYLPKPFPMEALLRLAAETVERRNAHASTQKKTSLIQQSSYEEELHA